MTSADAVVVFGITGDLAKKMTLRSLYRLEQRGVLDCPVVGVAIDDWTVDHLREHARKSIEASGEQVDDAVFDRLAKRLDYVSGDFSKAETYERLKQALGTAHRPVFYLEVPPSLFALVAKGLSEGGMLGGDARLVVEKPFGHDLRSARELAAELHKYIPERRLFRIDHFLGKMGLDEILYLRFANTMVEPVWNRHHVASIQITLAEAFGVEDRGHFYDPVGALRDVVVNHLMQVLAMATMEPPPTREPEMIKNAKFAVFHAMPAADPARYVRGQYDGYREIDGVDSDSQTETYAAVRLEIDNLRWAGVPIFIRAGKRLPVTQTELRIVFRDAPRLGFLPQGHRRPEPSQLVVKIDPSAGVRIVLDARRADSPTPAEIELDMEFADQGGEGPTPYEVLLTDAMRGDSTHFTRQDNVEETWRIMQPLIDEPPPVEQYQPGTWGPPAADKLIGRYGPWREPWLGDAGQRQRDSGFSGARDP